MKLSLFFVPVVVAGVILAHPTAAFAEFAVCNTSSYGTVTVAYVATWHDSQGTPYGQSQGWWKIEKNACKIIITTVDVSSYTFYIYAVAVAHPSQWWGGGNQFCLKPDLPFLFHGNAMEPPCASGKAYGMRLMDSGGASPYTYYLRD